jgi:hypothetical protein
MKPPKLILIILLMGIITATHAQTNSPTVIPPSPEAASLFRFLDYPVDLSTGTTDVNIPLYEVKCGSLSVPISISFHTGGSRANDVSGPIGLGWSLHSGGMISRTVHGKPDERVTAPTTIPNYNGLDYHFLASLFYPGTGTFSGAAPYPTAVYQEGDPEYDIYSYYFGSN